MADKAHSSSPLSRRRFLTSGAATAAGVLFLGPSRSQAEDAPIHRGFGADSRLLYTTPEMFSVARRRVAEQAEPWCSAWRLTEDRARYGLGVDIAPYHGPSRSAFIRAGDTANGYARDMAVAYRMTGEPAFAEKARDVLLAWADGGRTGNPSGESPISQGLDVTFAALVFCYAYSLVSDTFTSSERQVVEDWFAHWAGLIRKGLEHWDANDYFSKQYYQNHLVAFASGTAVIGFAIGDPQLVRFALNDPANPRNLEVLLDNAILMSNDDCWHADPTLTEEAPDVRPGEIYDRYFRVPGKLSHAFLSMRFFSLACEAALHNRKSRDYWEYVGPEGETLKLAYQFYSDFLVEQDAAVNGGYYTGDRIPKPHGVTQYEFGNRRYPDNAAIRSVPAGLNRVAYDARGMGWTAVLTHGLDNVPLAPAPPGGRTAIGWEFYEPGGLGPWYPKKNLSGDIRDGAWHLQIHGRDPSIATSNITGHGVFSESHTTLHLRMANDTDDDRAQLFFTTYDEPTFTGDKGLFFPIQPRSGFVDYRVDVGSHPRWSGIIERLRLDVVHDAESGSVAIDHLRLSP